MMKYCSLALDCLMILFIAIMAVVGMKKGFLKGLVGIIGVIAVTMLTALFSGAVAGLLERTFGTTTAVTNFFTNYFNGFNGFDAVVTQEELATVISEQLGMPVYLVHLFVNKVFAVTVTEGQTVAQALASSYAPMAMEFVVGTVLFIAMTLLLSGITKLFTKAVGAVPMLNYSNGLLGFLLGVLKALVIIALVAYLLSMLPYEKVQTLIDGTTYFSKISEYVVPRLAMIFMA